MAIPLHSVGGRLGRRPGRVGGSRRLMSEINVTPFVDVMLVLLVIFMVTAPLLTAGVQVDLPETDAAALPGKDEPLAVSVKRDGSIYIQETLIAFDALIPKLEAITEQNTKARIFVYGDKSTPYGTVMRIVSAIHTAGFTHVAFVTDPVQRAPRRR